MYVLDRIVSVNVVKQVKEEISFRLICSYLIEANAAADELLCIVLTVIISFWSYISLQWLIEIINFSRGMADVVSKKRIPVLITIVRVCVLSFLKILITHVTY